MVKEKDKKKIVDFKRYLNKDNPLTGKLYFGKLDHEIDPGFEAAVKLLEKKISKAISRSIEGQLWKSSGFNYDASIDDVQRSISLIVKAQATLDALGPSNDQEIPIAVNFSNTPPGYLEEADPDESQRQGVMQQKIPTSVLDDRILELARLLKDKKI